MREKLKNNSKIKIISLLSALVLWMYVMAVVDPEETKLFEDVPLNITNKDELNEKDLIIYPDVELTANIYITGKLSSLQKVEKNDISIYGQISNPIEGKNQIYLKATTPQRVTYEFKNPVIIVNLEKIVKSSKDIEIKVEGKSKNNIDKIQIENGINNITVTGPRSLVNKVDKIVASLNVGSKVDDFDTDLYLQPVDSDGNKVEGVELEKSLLTARVTLLKEKTVPIKVIFNNTDDSENKVNEYKLSQEYVDIKGKRDVIDKIDYINTQIIDLSNFMNEISREIALEIPSGVTCDDKYITISINTSRTIVSEFIYNSQEIELRNATEDFDVSQINIPENIKVSIEYSSNIGTVSKKDIILYIDLSQELGENEKYEIKYESEYEFDKIDIIPNNV